MAHAQKPDFVFRRNGRVHLKRQGGVSSVDYWQPRSAISGSNAGYTVFRGSVKGTGSFASFPFTSPPCVIVCHHVSTGVYAANQLCLFGFLGGTDCSIRSGFWCGMLFMGSVTDETNRIMNYCFVNCGCSILRVRRLASETVSSNKQDMLFNSADPITCCQSAITLCIAAAVGAAWSLPGSRGKGQPAL